jgi:two-component system, cell cycle response regulator
LRLRAATTRTINLEMLFSRQQPDKQALPKVLLIDERQSSYERIRQFLVGQASLDIVTDPQAGLFQANEAPYECVLISTALANCDPLRLCSQLRSLDRTRFVPIMLLADIGEDSRLVRALELGINDYLVRPIDRHELTARLRTQIKRKRYNDYLRDSVTETIEMAVTDALTGLHNRRYMDSHLKALFDRSVTRQCPLSVLILDLDRFKSVNDAYGHSGGDDVLREFARRLRENVRGIDLACRYGGEEFVVIMPDTDAAVAQRVAERIRSEIELEPFAVGKDGKTVGVTVSAGVSTLLQAADSVEALMKRADTALYEAKSAGRNRVVARAA